MKALVCRSMREVVEEINAEGIGKGDIEEIIEGENGYYVLYWA